MYEHKDFIMSSPFTGKQIQQATFTNNNRDTIEVVYNDAEEGAEPFYISVFIPGTDPDNYDVKNLFEMGYSYERVVDDTAVKLRQQTAALETLYSTMVAKQVQQQVETIKEDYRKRHEDLVNSGLLNNSNAALEVERIKLDYDQKYSDLVASLSDKSSNILKDVIDSNNDEEIIFKTKLAIFELPEVKKITDRSVKQKIRTAKTLMQLFGVLHEALQQ